MAKLLMLAGGIVEPGVGQPGAVSAYVALSSAGKSRLFKVQGRADAPSVIELDPATTVDLNRFRAEVKDDVRPALTAIEEQGGHAAVAAPRREWVTDLVARFLDNEGRD